ncbi:MAG TPA: class I SAM-dependent methyltransferase [Polyangiaceae bacterium]
MRTIRNAAALVLLGTLLSGAGNAGVFACSRSETPARTPDVPYEPSDPKVVDEMLRMANVGDQDLVYDLGCGDGRIVIAAVKRFGARGVCVDIDPVRIRESRTNAERAGVADRIEFRTQDLFQTEIANATAVMLFLWPEVNLELKPRLLRELAPGTRIVSHMHDMGNWKPDGYRTVDVAGRPHEIFLWVTPERK